MENNKELEELLLSWGVEMETIMKFQENNIKIENLQYLATKPEIIKELIPRIGPRLTFETNILKWSSDKDTATATTETVSSIATEITDISDNGQTDQIPIHESSEVFIDLDLSLVKDILPLFDLQTLLTTSPLGKSVIKYYETYNILDKTHRNRLVKIIVQHIYTFLTKISLDHSHYTTLAAKILTLFPNEKIGTYYVPAIKKADSVLNYSQKCKGKLPNAVRNIRYLSGDSIRNRKRATDDKKYGSDIPNKLTRTEEDDITIMENKIWLTHNVEPWSTVIEKWNSTFLCRRGYNNIPSIQEFLLDWPILNDLRSDVLINLDFEKLYPNSNLNFHLNWDCFIERVISQRGQAVKDSSIKEIISELPTFEEKLLSQIVILNHVVPPTGKIKLANKWWKFSTLESQEAIFLHVKDHGSVQSAINNKIESAYRRGATVQPFLLIVGQNIKEPADSVFIVVDRIKYEFQSVTRAFDTLFKLFHVFHACYPKESEHIYTLIQKAVYCIDLAEDKLFPDLMQFL